MREISARLSVPFSTTRKRSTTSTSTRTLPCWCPERKTTLSSEGGSDRNPKKKHIHTPGLGISESRLWICLSQCLGIMYAQTHFFWSIFVLSPRLCRCPGFLYFSFTATKRNAACFGRLAEGDNNIDAYNNILSCACTRLSPEHVNVNVCMKYG